MILRNYLGASTGSSRAQRILPMVWAFIIILNVFIFVTSAVIPGLQVGTDFYHFYSGGQIWNAQGNPYDFEVFRSTLETVSPRAASTNAMGYLYPPQATIMFSLYSHLPPTTGHLLMVLTNLVMLGLTLVLLIKILAHFRPVGLVDIALLTSLVNTGYGRGNVREGQLGIILFACLVIAFLLSQNRRHNLAGTVLGFVSIKPHFLPVFTAYHLLRGQFRIFIALVITVVVITLAPLLLSQRPVIEGVQDWIGAMSSARGNVNDSSPFIADSASIVSLEVVINRILNAQSTATLFLTWGLSGVAVLYLIFLSRREISTFRSEFFNFALMCLLSMLFIYHRSYDLFLLIPGVLYLYLVIHAMKHGRAKYVGVVFLIGIVVCMFLPGDFFTRITRSYPNLQQNYLWRVIAPFQAWATIVLTLVLLWQKQREAASAAPASASAR